MGDALRTVGGLHHPKNQTSSLATATPVTRDVLRAPGVTHTGFGRRSVRKIFPQRRVEALQKRSGKEPNAETRGVWFYFIFFMRGRTVAQTRCEGEEGSDEGR